MIFVCWKSALHLFLFTFIQHPRSVRLRLSTLHTVQHLLVFESFTDSLLANHTELGRKDVRCRASQRCAALLSAASRQMGRHLLGVVTPRREQQRHLANPAVGKFTFFRCKSHQSPFPFSPPSPFPSLPFHSLPVHVPLHLSIMTGGRVSSLTHVLEARWGCLAPRMEGKREAHYVESKSLPRWEVINIKGHKNDPVNFLT